MTIFVLYYSHKGRALEKMLDSAMTGGLKIAILRMCQGQMWPDWEPPRLSQQDVTLDIERNHLKYPPRKLFKSNRLDDWGYRDNIFPTLKGEGV